MNVAWWKAFDFTQRGKVKNAGNAKVDQIINPHCVLCCVFCDLCV